jgi:hypothetical protein
VFVLALWLATCDALKQLRVPEMTVTSAQVVPAGAFQLPAGGPHASAPATAAMAAPSITSASAKGSMATM